MIFATLREVIQFLEESYLMSLENVFFKFYEDSDDTEFEHIKLYYISSKSENDKTVLGTPFAEILVGVGFCELLYCDLDSKILNSRVLYEIFNYAKADNLNGMIEDMLNGDNKILYYEYVTAKHNGHGVYILFTETYIALNKALKKNKFVNIE